MRGAGDGFHSGGHHFVACEAEAGVLENSRVDAVVTSNSGEIAVAQQRLPKLVPLAFAQGGACMKLVPYAMCVEWS